MANTKKGSIVKSTRQGRLYIKTSDFFNQERIQKTISLLLESDIIKEIEERKKSKLQEV